MTTIKGFHHVKLPVADVARSRDWYRRVLGFEVTLEFVEDGTLMGLALSDPGGSAQLAIRRDPARVPRCTAPAGRADPASRAGWPV